MPRGSTDFDRARAPVFLYSRQVATTGDRRAGAAGSDAWRELFEAKPVRGGELFSTMSGIENEAG
jgi:hypothetical protein